VDVVVEQTGDVPDALGDVRNVVFGLRKFQRSDVTKPMSMFFRRRMSTRFWTEPLPRIGSTRSLSPSSSTEAMSEPMIDIGPPIGAVITVTVPALRRSRSGSSLA